MNLGVISSLSNPNILYFIKVYFKVFKIFFYFYIKIYNLILFYSIELGILIIYGYDK